MSPETGGLPDWLWSAFPLLFVVIWIVVVQLVSSAGGWRALAETYPAAGEPSSLRLRFRSARMRHGTNYNGVITFVSSPAGLHLSVFLPFRFGHGPIFVPWTDVSVETGRLLFVPTLTFRFARRPEIPLRVQRGLGQKLLRAAGRAVPRG